MEAQKQITVHSEHTEGAPVIYLPVVMGDGSEVYDRCRELDCPPFTLVAIGGLDWNRELSPWECDGTVRDAEPFGGQAAAFLDELLSRIIPEAEPSLPCPPTWRGIAGYSLAGLFSLWFDICASCAYLRGFSCSRLANGVFCVANGYANASVAGACEDNEPHRQAAFARRQASCAPRDSRHGEPRRRPPAIRACAHRQPRNAPAGQRSRKPYGCGTSAGNCGSFGVPMRRDNSTSHGSQPWLISTSLCTDMYM